MVHQKFCILSARCFFPSKRCTSHPLAAIVPVDSDTLIRHAWWCHMCLGGDDTYITALTQQYPTIARHGRFAHRLTLIVEQYAILELSDNVPS